MNRFERSSLHDWRVTVNPKLHWSMRPVQTDASRPGVRIVSIQLGEEVEAHRVL